MQLKGHIEPLDGSFSHRLFRLPFCKKISHLMHALEYTTQRALTSFPISSLSLFPSRSLSSRGSTAIQIQTSLLSARTLIHTCDPERAHGCERYAWKGSWLHKECGQVGPRCVGDLIRCEYMQAPLNQSLPLLHRSRSEHTRRVLADRSANFNTSLPPSRPPSNTFVYVRGSLSPKPPRVLYVHGMQVCVYVCVCVCVCVLRARQNEACVRVGVDCFARDVRVRVQRHGCIWRRRDI